MGFLDPKPITAAGVDAATAGHVNDPASQTRIALDGSFATDAEVASKLDKTEAATTYAAKSVETTKLDKTEAAATYATTASVTAQVSAEVPPEVADYIANDPSVVQSAATMAQTTEGLVPVWKASTSYTAGQRAIAPNGDIVSAKVAFTSGATYNAADWNASTQAIALDGKLDKTTVATATVQGIVELATAAEALAGADTQRAVTPAGLAGAIAAPYLVKWRGTLPVDTSLDGMDITADRGWWDITLPNLPSHAGIPAGFTYGSVMNNGNAWSSFQIYVEAGTGRMAIRYIQNPTSNTWSTWRVMASVAELEQLRADLEAATGTAAGDLSMDSLHIGDSLTDDVVLGANQWGRVLATLTGRDHSIKGWYNQETFEIGARMGANAYPVTVTGGSIPASGTTVVVTGLRTDQLAFGGYAGLMARNIPGWINGRHGQLRNPDNGPDMDFTTDDGQTGTTAATGTAWFEGDMRSLTNRITTIWTGTNDRGEETPERLVAMVQAMLGKLRNHRRVLVFGLFSDPNNTQTANAVAINNAYESAFPGMYFDPQAPLMTAQAATDAGITFTAQDDTDIANGHVPTSFRSDTVHLNANGAKALAHAIYREYQARGWAV